MSASCRTGSAAAHLNGASSISPSTDIVLSGSVDAENKMSLVSSPGSLATANAVQ